MTEFNNPVGSRRFEHPAPVAPAPFVGAVPAGLQPIPAAVRGRNKRLLVDTYSEMWRRAVQQGVILRAPARRHGGSGVRHQVERGNLAADRSYRMDPKWDRGANDPPNG